MKRYIFKVKNKLLHIGADNILTAKNRAKELYGDNAVFKTIEKIYGLK